MFSPFNYHFIFILILGVVADNASNGKKAIRLMNLLGFGCFAHTLQLAVNEVLKMDEIKVFYIVLYVLTLINIK